MKKYLLLICFIVFVFSSASVASAESEVFPFTGIVNVKKVNIRAGQSKNFEALGEFKEGDQVVVVQKSYSWYKIKLPEHAKCYVSRKLVHFLRDQIGEINGNRVNIRARANINSAVLGQLNKMTKVKIVETLDEWYRIQPVEGLHGWVASDFIDFNSKDILPPNIVQLPTRNIYKIKQAEVARQKEEEATRRIKEESVKVRLKGKVTAISAQDSSKNVRHQLAADDGKIFYLMGYRSILDGFLNHRVQIEGLPQDDAGMVQPVLLVTKVLLVL